MRDFNGINMKGLNDKEISLLQSVISTTSAQNKLDAYIKAHGKAVEAYEDFIDEVLANKEAAKSTNETVNTKQHKDKHCFKVGDKVKLIDKCDPDLLRFFNKDTVFAIVKTTNGEDGPYPFEIKTKNNNTGESHGIRFHGNYNGKIHSFFEKVSDTKGSTIKSDENKKRKEVIQNALKYVDKKYRELSLAGLDPLPSSVITESSTTVTLSIKDINSGITLRESKAVCPSKYVFNGYIGVAIALSKLLNDKKAYTYFSDAPQPTIAVDQYAMLEPKLSRSRYLDATYVLPAEDDDYVMLDGVKIKKDAPLEGVCRIISDDIAIY